MKEKRAPRNTAKEVRDNPILGLVTAMSERGSGILPTDMGSHSDYDTKAILEAAGMKFLGVVEGDDMFQYVELPKGWKKVAI